MRNWSTARAVERPSAIAHTTSEAPRCASPHTNTPGVSVCQSLPQDSAPRRLGARPSPSSSGPRSTPSNPIANNASSQGISIPHPPGDGPAPVGVPDDGDLGQHHRGDIAVGVAGESLHRDLIFSFPALGVRR